MQTILGAGGAIGIPLAKELLKYTEKVRLVARNPQKVNPGDELFPADLREQGQVMEAVKGSEAVYLVAGLKYDTKVWQKEWPIVMNNVITACSENNSKLVFLDNVYMYGRVEGRMTEETPFNPVSHKGEIRARIAQRLIDAYKSKEIEAAILRSADFYGPDNKGSVLNMLVLDRLRTGKKANLLLSADRLHTYTYTPDAAKAMALIGNTPEAYNQTWHAPSDMDLMTGEGFVRLAAGVLKVKPEYTVLKKWQIKLAGIFSPVVRESIEMIYQNEYDYIFDSSKFESCFKIKPTSYSDGITAYLKG
ncbi:MAG: NAD-dependent epimerase/dehydratase family protein [Ignavibacteria bacterium]|jgi:nucleoside-diphosphate-sugar epimerase|nr:NAD-dependent epimerase/dehydratase family protein [Ignavibacteria bacterium]MCU7504944.1 NAD-dependent epimerase/dehydratase family protein [Ignavibacteria bacterium]MCU7518397.1 NAD-dependent epimerase/dehydratase family protein [Ignavibacteria bacterium]